jgi:hypothetical protein
LQRVRFWAQLPRVENFANLGRLLKRRLPRCALSSWLCGHGFVCFPRLRWRLTENADGTDTTAARSNCW